MIEGNKRRQWRSVAPSNLLRLSIFEKTLSQYYATLYNLVSKLNTVFLFKKIYFFWLSSSKRWFIWLAAWCRLFFLSFSWTCLECWFCFFFLRLLLICLSMEKEKTVFALNSSDISRMKNKLTSHLNQMYLKHFVWFRISFNMYTPHIHTIS